MLCHMMYQRSRLDLFILSGAVRDPNLSYIHLLVYSNIKQKSSNKGVDSQSSLPERPSATKPLTHLESRLPTNHTHFLPSRSSSILNLVIWQWLSQLRLPKSHLKFRRGINQKLTVCLYELNNHRSKLLIPKLISYEVLTTIVGLFINNKFINFPLIVRLIQLSCEERDASTITLRSRVGDCIHHRLPINVNFWEVFPVSLNNN